METHKSLSRGPSPWWGAIPMPLKCSLLLGGGGWWHRAGNPTALLKLNCCWFGEGSLCVRVLVVGCVPCSLESPGPSDSASTVYVTACSSLQELLWDRTPLPIACSFLLLELLCFSSRWLLVFRVHISTMRLVDDWPRPLPINLHKAVLVYVVTLPQEKLSNSLSINFKRAKIRITKEKDQEKLKSASTKNSSQHIHIHQFSSDYGKLTS